MALREVRYQAAILKDGAILLVRFAPPEGKGDPFWVFPGGGMEPGETDQECIAREVREEVGLEVSVVRLLFDTAAEPPDGTYKRWRTYLCTVVSGNPAPGGGEGEGSLTAVCWVDLANEEQWDPEILNDPYLYPQFQRIRAELQNKAF